jgi:hypothetical protein
MDHTDNNRPLEELLKTDFSQESNSKEKMLNQLLLKIEEQKCSVNKKENFTMKKSFIKPAFVAAVIAVSIIGLAMTSYGQDFYRVIKEVLVGEHARYIVTEQTGAQADVPALPDELKGKLYDRDGNVLEQFPENGEIYNRNGEKLILQSVYTGDGNKLAALTEKEYDELQKSKLDDYTVMTDFEEAKSYLSFDFSLPAYLPEGYVFDRIRLYNDETGKPIKNCDYADVYFTNGDHARDIYLQLRLMNEETAYEASIGNVEEIDINGNKGVIGEGSIDVEIDGVMYMIRVHASGIDNEQLIKMAESIKR